jgi:hypothetical protein
MLLVQWGLYLGLSKVYPFTTREEHSKLLMMHVSMDEQERGAQAQEVQQQQQQQQQEKSAASCCCKNHKP